jgi:hypothetical protein
MKHNLLRRKSLKSFSSLFLRSPHEKETRLGSFDEIDSLEGNKSKFTRFVSLKLAVFFLFSLSVFSGFGQMTVSTIAGNGTAGFSDGSSSNAIFNFPRDIISDNNGNVYVADRTNHRIRKINSSGIVTTLAGSGTTGNSDGNGTAAQFNAPGSLCFDNSGNIIVADEYNKVLRKIDNQGNVTTISSSINASQGAQITGVTIDPSGNYYILCAQSNRIYKINTSNNVSVFTGPGAIGPGASVGFELANFISSDASGNIYVTDYFKHTVTKILPDGTGSVFIGTSGQFGDIDGNGTSVKLHYPGKLQYSNDGNFYLCDAGNHKIKKVTPSGDVTTYTGTGAPGSTDGNSTQATFKSPFSAVLDNNLNLIVVDYENHKIRKVSASCTPTSSAQDITACNSYLWSANNTTYTTSGSYNHTLTNAAGCDSTVTLNLTIKNSTTGSDTQTACDAYTWIDGNTYTTSNNTATHTLTNAAGCDSTVTLNLTIKNSTTGTDTQTACDTYTWIDGNTYTTSNNTATHTLTNAAGCDSVVTLNLTVNPSYSISNTYTIEQGESIVLEGVSRSTSGVYTTPLTSINGCDSTRINTVNVIAMYAPSDLAVNVVSQSQINLSWLDNSSNEQGFMIERADSPTGTFTQVGFVNANVTTFSDLTDLVANTTYCYRVASVDAGGNYSAYTATVCGTTLPVVPVSPSNLVAIANAQTVINLTWADNSTDELGFIISRSMGVQGFVTIDTVAANTTNYSSTGLTANTSYSYKVVAYHAGGNSPASNIATATTFDNIATAATNLVATPISALQNNLTWNDVATNETAYIVERSLTSGSGFTTIATLPANSTSYGDANNVIANTTYFYRVSTSNSGGQAVSNEAGVLTNATCAYTMESIAMNCRDAQFCMPVNPNHPIVNGLGFDFTLSFDTSKYDFNGLSINPTLIDPSYAEYTSNTNADGSISFLVNIVGSAPAGTYFNGNGSILCLDFNKRLDHEQGVDQISIATVRESYSTGTSLFCSNNGIITVTKDTLAPGNLRSWNNIDPLSYNSSNTAQFLVTKIYGTDINCSNPSTNFTTPDMNGQFNHNIYDGEFIQIVRDIDASTLMMSFINGMDATLAKKIALSKPDFTPNVYQVIASDVNMDGVVSAGDISLIKKRSTHKITEFPQAWNYTGNTSNGQPSKDWLFIDSAIVSNPAYQISSSYPNYDGVGFNKDNVPSVAMCMKVPATYIGNCPEFSQTPYTGILLGDIDGSFNQYAAGGLRGSDEESTSITLDINNVIFQSDCTVDIPFYVGSQVEGELIAADFDLVYNQDAIEFVDIFVANNAFENDFNAVDGHILFTTSDIDPIAASTLLGHIRFNILTSELNATTFENMDAYMNGVQKSGDINGAIVCSNGINATPAPTINDLNVYPNPTKGEFNIDLTAITGEVTIQVTDLTGKLIKTVITKGSSIEKVQLAELSNGIYMIHVNTLGANYAFRVIRK